MYFFNGNLIYIQSLVIYIQSIHILSYIVILECFAKNYARLFDIPVNSRIDNDVSGHSPAYIPAAG